MKEITRRLYTKPVMLGMLFLVGMALVVGLFGTAKSGAAPDGFPVPAGNDEFETTANGETFHDFAGSPIPANFFGDGSNAFSELVPLEGVPLSEGSNVDTIIERQQEVSAPGGSTTLAMTGLSLKSTRPITVTYSNSDRTESWDVHVGLSLFKSSTGTMTINSGTFDSTLQVWPRFTFTRVGGGVSPKVLDTGDTGGGLTTNQTAASDSDSLSAIAPAPCKAVAIDTFETRINSTFSAAATSSCPPVTLSSVNSPWQPCPPNGFCIPVPITEAERWARHNPSPKGTKQQAIGE